MWLPTKVVTCSLIKGKLEYVVSNKSLEFDMSQFKQNSMNKTMIRNWSP